MEEKVYFRSTDNLLLCGILSTLKKPSNKCVILCHGITVDKEEDGGFSPLAQTLNSYGFDAFRFDFRGHGESYGKIVNMTITGEISDLLSAKKFLKSKGYLNFAIVGASFGAIPSVYCANRNDIKCLILWYPVLDLVKTFLNPKLPWAKKSFNKKGFGMLSKKGYLLLGVSKLGKKLISEMSFYKPFEQLSKINIPVLTMHGDKDTYVPYSVAKRYGKPNSKSRFITLHDAEHGPTEIHLGFLVNETAEWVNKYL